MAGMAALKQLLSKGGDEGKALLQALGSKADDMAGMSLKDMGAGAKRAGEKGLFALDKQLGKVPGMAAKQDPLFMTDDIADPRKRNALLAALGLGGAGAGLAYGLDED